MKKNIIITLGVVAVLILVVTITLIMLPKNNKNNDEDKNIETTTNEAAKQDYITYSEWISMLYEEMGITELDSDSEVAFDGEEPVTGEFMALSAMKTIGDAKMQIYLNTDKEITDEIYIDTALKLNLISDSELNEYISHVVAQKIVKNLKSMYYNEFWPDDYEVVEYNENVKEIAEENIVSYDENASSLVVSEKFANTLSEGAIIVFTDEATGLKCARKVETINEGGVLDLNDNVKLEEVFEEFVVSDTDELCFEDISAYYQFENSSVDKSVYTYGNIDGHIETTKFISNDYKPEGFVINLSRDKDDDKIIVEVGDDKTGETGKIESNETTNDEEDLDIEIKVEEIYIGVQLKYTSSAGMEYVDVTVGADTSISGTFAEFEEEERISLFKTPVPIGNGWVGVDVELYLVINADGSISFEAEIPVEASIGYESGKRIKKPNYNINIPQPHFEGACNASAFLVVEPTLVILECIDVMDFQAKMGIVGEAKIENKPNKQVCSDVVIAFPVFKVSLCGDGKSDTLMGILGITKEWDIISVENAPQKLQLHSEILPDGKIQIVDECTYIEEETVEVGGNVEETVETMEESTTESIVQDDTTKVQSSENETTSSVSKEEETTKQDETSGVGEDNGVDNNVVYGPWGNQGQIVRQGDWIYYATTTALCKMKIDGTGLYYIVNQKNIIGITVDKDWIYYTVDIDSARRGFYRIKSDGTECSEIIEGYSGRVWVNDGYCFYEKGGCLNKISVDGKDTEVVVTKRGVAPILFENGWIYYTVDDPESSYAYGYNIFKIRNDGSDDTFLGTVEGEFYNTDENAIYYHKNYYSDTDKYKTITKINKDGSGIEIQKVQYHSVESGGITYYISSDGDLCCTDGENTKMLVDVNYVPVLSAVGSPITEEQKNSVIAEIYMIDNEYIYYVELKEYQGDYIWYMLKLDGTEKIIIEDCSMLEYICPV